MDDVQYDKRYTNRNRIITPSGWTWITVPINKNHKFLPNYSVEINNEIPWREEHWKKIQHSYSKARFFHLYKDYLYDTYKKEWSMLFELDMQITRQIIKWLGLKINIIKESELNVTGESSQRLVNVCKAIGADTYVSGQGGKNYLDESLFDKNNIKLGYQKYEPVPYQQYLAKTFIPNLSIIDLLANVGPESSKFIHNQSVKESLPA